MNALLVPDLARHGPGVREQVTAAVGRCVDALRRGDNLLLYPSGHVYRSRFEDLRGNSAVESILRQCPDVRVVLIRTTGLWGSAFSYAAGGVPGVGRVLRRAVRSLVLNGLFFSPRRHVHVELHEPEDLPRHSDRNAINRFLEDYYNRVAPPNTYVPYTHWERGGTLTLPDPSPPRLAGSSADVPEATRQLVTAYLRQATGRARLGDDERLAHDLGMDSLARADLVLWLANEFGFNADVYSLKTVGDVLLAACGESISSAPAMLKPVPPRWFRRRGDARLAPPSGRTVTEAFLYQARRRPDQVIVADQTGGAKTFRDLVTAILALRPHIERLPGERVGILLPASVGADIVYLASLFAGKTPVMVNWTAGARNTLHGLDVAEVRRVLTSRVFVGRLESLGTDLAALKDRLVCLEDVGRAISRPARLWAWLRARTTWASLAGARVPETAVVLFTSGSETLPKVVPLSHTNVLTNLGDIATIVALRESDRLLGMLPPFHSFGLTVNMLAPLTVGIRTVYHPNPTDGAVLAKMIEAYGVSILVGTPTFLNGIVRAAGEGQLASLRLAVTGAEKCPQRVYEALAQSCPRAVILEGYGITECSPVVAANRDGCVRPFTIGLPLPSVEHAIVDVDTAQPVGEGRTGLLLVRGPSVFAGYLGGGASPFVEHDGRLWYRTGDLVSRDAEGVLTFRGRLKRFVKRGGEMISLPAVEAVLESLCPGEGDEGPALAVEATPDESRPELVLFTTRDIDRQDVNRHIRDSGLSPLHNITRVVRVERIPVLGTGKTDYRALRDMLGR